MYIRMTALLIVLDVVCGGCAASPGPGTDAAADMPDLAEPPTDSGTPDFGDGAVDADSDAAGSDGGPALQVIDVAAGGEHSCAIVVGGDLYCWGYQAVGQLGYLTPFGASSPLPQRVPGITGAIDVAAGYSHTCVRLTDESVRCFGNGASGQLGDGTTDIGIPTPRRVLGLSQPVSELSLGGLMRPADERSGVGHSCALLNDATVVCWGDNSRGQIGDGTTTNRLVPGLVPGLASVRTVASGGRHTCAAMGDGRVFCWGDNSVGQLGTSIPDLATSPQLVPDVSDAVELSAGAYHTCALHSDGTFTCWGCDIRSTPLTPSGFCPVHALPYVVDPGPIVGVAARVTAGAVHGCIGGTGGVACWGSNAFGMLGDGTFADRATVGPVAGLSSVTQLDGHWFHTCAVITGGALRCWGLNSAGELGDGSIENHAAPIEVRLP